MIEREKLVSMVQDLKDGKEDAATVIYETFHRSVYYHILKLVNNDSELAADLTQDTFIYVLEKIHALEEPAAFVVWINKIASSKCKDYSIKRKELLVDEYEDGYTIFDQVEEIREEFIPGEALDKEDLKRIILNIINGLPTEQREAIILRYFNEISVKEIADIQGVSEGTVKSRLNYGRKSLKDAVETYEKKNDIRLHCTGIIPLLLWFFRAYRTSNGMSLTSSKASATFVSSHTAATKSTASATSKAASISSSVANSTACTGVKIASKSVATKAIAAVAAATVAVGGVSIGLNLSQSSKNYIDAETTETYSYVQDTFIEDTRPEIVDTIAEAETEIPITEQPVTDTFIENGNITSTSMWRGTTPMSGGHVEVFQDPSTNVEEWITDQSQVTITNSARIVFNPMEYVYLSVSEINETTIKGSLTLEFGNDKFESAFSGTGSKYGNCLTYIITLSTPRTNCGNSNIDTLTLTFNLTTDTFEIIAPTRYSATLNPKNS